MVTPEPQLPQPAAEASPVVTPQALEVFKTMANIRQNPGQSPELIAKLGDGNQQKGLEIMGNEGPRVCLALLAEKPDPSGPSYGELLQEQAQIAVNQLSPTATDVDKRQAFATVAHTIEQQMKGDPKMQKKFGPELFDLDPISTFAMFQSETPPPAPDSAANVGDLETDRSDGQDGAGAAAPDAQEAARQAAINAIDKAQNNPEEVLRALANPEEEVVRANSRGLVEALGKSTLLQNPKFIERVQKLLEEQGQTLGDNPEEAVKNILTNNPDLSDKVLGIAMEVVVDQIQNAKAAEQASLLEDPFIKKMIEVSTKPEEANKAIVDAAPQDVKNAIAELKTAKTPEQREKALKSLEKNEGWYKRLSGGEKFAFWALIASIVMGLGALPLMGPGVPLVLAVNFTNLGSIMAGLSGVVYAGDTIIEKIDRGLGGSATASEVGNSSASSTVSNQSSVPSNAPAVPSQPSPTQPAPEPEPVPQSPSAPVSPSVPPAPGGN